MNDPSKNRTETEERVAENATPSPHTPVTRQTGDTDPATGMPPGMHDDDRSPLDPGGPLDPIGGAAATKAARDV